MSVESRASFLDRLATLLQRGITLSDALGAFAQDPDKDWAAAAERALPFALEGASLATVLEESGLVTEADTALLRAGEGDGSRPLSYVASELKARARLASAVHAALVAPLWKFMIVGFLGMLVVLIQVCTTQVMFPEHIGSGLFLRDPWVSSTLTFVCMSMMLCMGGRFAWGIVWRPATRRMLEAAARESMTLERLLLLENGARFLRALGTAFEVGLPLTGALAHAKRVFHGRVVADEIDVLCGMAEEGAPLDACLSLVPFLDATTLWTLEHALHRPDLPAELLAVADTLQEDLVRELEVRTPFLTGAANLAFALPILLSAAVLLTGVNSYWR
jgi:type II secretory pathway component PulF